MLEKQSMSATASEQALSGWDHLSKTLNMFLSLNLVGDWTVLTQNCLFKGEHVQHSVKCGTLWRLQGVRYRQRGGRVWSWELYRGICFAGVYCMTYRIYYTEIYCTEKPPSCIAFSHLAHVYFIAFSGQNCDSGHPCKEQLNRRIKQTDEKEVTICLDTRQENYLHDYYWWLRWK